MNRLMSLIVAVVAILALSAPALAAQSPIVLEFEKSNAADGYYVGTIDGGGTLQMWLAGRELHGNTQHFTATVQVDGSSAGSFTAVVRGKINLQTGAVVLNGTVTEGDYEGARVSEQSQLIGFSPLTFAGTISIMPASS